MEFYVVRDGDGKMMWRGFGGTGAAALQVLPPGLTAEIVTREEYADLEQSAMSSAE